MPNEWILGQFNNDNCPNLKGKPKLFIFQACRYVRKVTDLTLTGFEPIITQLKSYDYASFICRGDDPDYGTTITIPRLEAYTESDAKKIPPESCAEMDYPDRMQKVPTVEDMLIAYATIPGYVANRDNMRGTWFIESICKVFMKNAADMDIKEMMDEVKYNSFGYNLSLNTTWVRICHF